MLVIFALVAAVGYGSADFLGGVASRRARALSVLTVSAPAGAVILLGAALAAGGLPRMAGLGWAVAAGAAGGTGLIVFYAGLASGPMSVVAPISALVSTVLPIGVALAAGERPGPAVYAGGLICLVAIAAVSMERGPPGQSANRPGTARGIACGGLSGVAFGMFMLFLRNAGESGVLWPAAASRITGTVIMIGVAAWLGAPPAWRGGGRLLLAAIAAGVLDAGANVCYLLATRAGLLGLAVVLTSLYPGVTVLLARVVLGERLRSVQRAGLVLAAVGVLLVTA